MKKRILAVVLVMAMVLGTITPAFGATVTVSTDGSLAAAIANATAGDVIQVDGEITEAGSITIDKNITITSTSGGKVTLSDTITVNGGGALTINGNVTLSGNNTKTVITVNGGTLNMEGGTITGGGGWDGGGVKLENLATFTMNGGTITGNTADCGGGVYVSDGSTFTMNGGAITGNTAQSYGGGVDLRKDNNAGHVPTFNMTGGTISDNTANGTMKADGSGGGGGGVRNDDCTFNMTGGTISNNHAPNALGGGVLIYVGGENNITNGAITGNTASANNGGGVHSLWGNAPTLSGNVNITGNTNATDGNSDVYLQNGQAISLNNLGPDSQVGIITQTIPSETNRRVRFAQGGNQGDSESFFKDVLTNPVGIYQENGDLYLVYGRYAASYGGKYYDTVAEALAAAEADGSASGNVVVNEQYDPDGTGANLGNYVENSVQIPDGVTLSSNGATFTGGSANDQLTVNVGQNGEITVTDGQGEIETTGTAVKVQGSDGSTHQVGGTFTVVPAANGTGIEKVSVNAVDVTIDGTTYHNTANAEFMLGGTNLSSGKVDLPNNNDSVDLAKTDGTPITITKTDGTGTIVVDATNNTVTVPAGTTVTIDGVTYKAPAAPADGKAVLTIDPATGKVTLSTGSLELDPSESVNVATGGNNSESIPVRNDGQTGKVIVTAGTAVTPIQADVTDSAAVTFDNKTYQAAPEATLQYQGADKPAKLVSGSVNLGDGKSVVGASDKTITNPAGSGNDQDFKVEADAINKQDIVTVGKGAAGATKVEITDGNGNKVSYQAEPDTRLAVNKDKTTELLEGTVNLTDGQEIDVQAKNRSDPLKVESTGPITVNRDSINDETTATVPDGSAITITDPTDLTKNGAIKPDAGTDVTVTLGATSMITDPITDGVTANGQKYQAAGQNDTYTLDVPYDGSTPKLTDGKLNLPTGNEVKVGKTGVTNTGTSPIIVSALDNTATVANGGSFETKPSGNVIENVGPDEQVFDIDSATGDVTAALKDGQSVVINGVTYTGGSPNGGSVTVRPDGTVEIVPDVAVSIDPEKFNDPTNLQYTLPAGVPVTVGGYVYLADEDNAVALKGELSDSGNPVVELAEADDVVHVAVRDEDPAADGTAYTAGAAHTEFTMTEPEDTADDTKVNLLSNGNTSPDNSTLKFGADEDAHVDGVTYSDATGEYTVEFNAEKDENGGVIPDENGNPTTVQNKVTTTATVKATFDEEGNRLTVNGLMNADGTDKPVVAGNAGASVTINSTEAQDRNKVKANSPTVVQDKDGQLIATRQPGSRPTYNMVVGPKGNAAVNPGSASTGQIVTITATPNPGYSVEQVTVTDRKGNQVSVISVGNNKYTFVQPADAPVEIRVTFTNGGSGVIDNPAYDACTKDQYCPIHPFTDASTTAWYHDGVHYVLDKGIMVGTSATAFQPYANTTRGTIVTMLWRLMNTPVVNYAMTFGDVPAGMWYTEAVRWAASNDIVNGYSSAVFGPNDAITREQLATILYRYAQYRGYDVSARADLSKFVDYDQVSDYATEALAWANAKGLIVGTDTNALAPKAQATRAEAATIMMRFCEGIAK